MVIDMALEMGLRKSERKEQIKILKKRNSNQYEIFTIHNPVSFSEGLSMVIRACQQLSQEIDGITLVAVAGPTGSGKTVFTGKIVEIMPSVAVIEMDNYKYASRVIDGNFDDPYLIDYDKLLKDINGLKAGKAVQVPVYDFNTRSRIRYRTIEAPSTRIVIIKGIYALSEKLRPFTNLRVSLKGGVHFDLIRRVLTDIRRAGHDPEESIRQISKTLYPLYMAINEPELQRAHMKVINEFDPFSGSSNPTYILKSTKSVPVDQIRAVFLEDHWETTEDTYDLYLLPPGENPEACRSYLRMRNKDGKYSLVFEEWTIDSPFIISPTLTFEVSVHLLGGLMTLGYTIPFILKRSSRIFSDGKVCVKTDWLEQLNRHYIQVRGRDRKYVKYIADQLGLDGSYVPRTYMEQIQLEKLINDVMALPDDLKAKFNIDDDLAMTPKEALSRAAEERRREFLNRFKKKSELKNLTRSCYGRHEAFPRTTFNQRDEDVALYTYKDENPMGTEGNPQTEIAEPVRKLKILEEQCTSEIAEEIEEVCESIIHVEQTCKALYAKENEAKEELVIARRSLISFFELMQHVLICKSTVIGIQKVSAPDEETPGEPELWNLTENRLATIEETIRYIFTQYL